jgi:hypothetical protein
MSVSNQTSMRNDIQNCVALPSPPLAIVTNPGFALQLAPQDQLIVVLGLQYAVDAKNVYGLYAEIWEVVSVPMACLRSTVGMAAASATNDRSGATANIFERRYPGWEVLGELTSLGTSEIVDHKGGLYITPARISSLFLI